MAEREGDRVSLIQADARKIPLKDRCVQTVVTSPPYYGLRNYGTDAQIGLEKTFVEYVDALRVVFAEVFRVLVDETAADRQRDMGREDTADRQAPLVFSVAR